MTVPELVIWSAAVGALALVALVGLVDAVLIRHMSALQGPLYNLAAMLFVMLLSGLLPALEPALDGQALRVAQVLAGPLCVALGDNFVRLWLSAPQRDRLMDVSLRGAGIVGPLLGVGCLLLPPQQQLPAVTAVVMVNSGIVLWMTVRAWLLGDSLALGVAIGSALMMPAVGGLYAMALGLPGIGTGLQSLIALVSVVCITVIGLMLWKRNQHARRVRGFEPVLSQYDAVTKLPGGIPFVRELHKAQRRRRRTQRDGALLAVTLFGPDAIKAQAGQAGLNEVYMHIAQRLQRQVGVVNPVGRYWERCFVVLVETIHSPAALRTLGLRVASSLRRPMEVKGQDGGELQVRVEIGVGVVHLGRKPVPVDDLLHDAQELAEAARAMRSRAATRDPVSGQVVPVEHANLTGGGRRHKRFGPMVHVPAVAGSLRPRA